MSKTAGDSQETKRDGNGLPCAILHLGILVLGDGTAIIPVNWLGYILAGFLDAQKEWWKQNVQEMSRFAPQSAKSLSQTIVCTSTQFPREKWGMKRVSEVWND